MTSNATESRIWHPGTELPLPLSHTPEQHPTIRTAQENKTPRILKTLPPKNKKNKKPPEILPGQKKISEMMKFWQPKQQEEKEEVKHPTRTAPTHPPEEKHPTQNKTPSDSKCLKNCLTKNVMTGRSQAKARRQLHPTTRIPRSSSFSEAKNNLKQEEKITPHLTPAKNIPKNNLYQNTTPNNKTQTLQETRTPKRKLENLSDGEGEVDIARRGGFKNARISNPRTNLTKTRVKASAKSNSISNIVNFFNYSCSGSSGLKNSTKEEPVGPGQLTLLGGGGDDGGVHVGGQEPDPNGEGAIPAVHTKVQHSGVGMTALDKNFGTRTVTGQSAAGAIAGTNSSWPRKQLELDSVGEKKRYFGTDQPQLSRTNQ